MNVLQTNPHLGFTGQVALATGSGLPVWGNTIEVDGFPRIYQFGTFSPINATLADDDVLFFFLPEDGSVPSGWQPAADVYPWRDPVTPNLWVMPQPRRQRPLQLAAAVPDSITSHSPMTTCVADRLASPFYEILPAPGGGTGGGGGGGSSRPGAGVL